MNGRMRAAMRFVSFGGKRELPRKVRDVRGAPASLPYDAGHWAVGYGQRRVVRFCRCTRRLLKLWKKDRGWRMDYAPD